MWGHAHNAGSEGLGTPSAFSDVYMVQREHKGWAGWGVAR